ncbi:hypothetical protein NQ318_003725 [Aromia moschata]|uniref:Uncharacterized protein n=1 Tax=Aromia moschata TaxID=1265417 RepID=A0AAV8XGZ9_9CUCU|nr:hypothetical protein NQ318_003725 [Aromia moschata]
MGFIDQQGYEAISSVAEDTKISLDAEKFVEATNLWGKTEYAVEVETNFGVDFYNVLTKIKSLDEKNQYLKGEF